MTFQSRFGRARWLEPYTIETVKALAKKGVKNLVVVTPGFSADCLETLEEIAVENAHVFKRDGGEELRRHSVPQRQRGRHADDLATRHARAQGLGVIFISRCRAEIGPRSGPVGASRITQSPPRRFAPTLPPDREG